MNWKVFIYAQVQFVRALLQVPKALFSHGIVSAPKRFVVFLIIMPIWFLLNTMHWLGFLLDEVFFRHWRKQTIEKPVFIVGVPRSGTTFLHRTLAQDSRFTSTPLWELVFAPSITEKFLVAGVVTLFKPLAWMIKGINFKFLRQMESIHKLGLDEPEEDFLFLLSLNACFILIALFPEDRKLWQLSKFDQDLSDTEKSIISKFYKACIQKHMAFKGSKNKSYTLRYLSKNPSFSPAVFTLKTEFTNANFVVCVRDPEIVVPSQIRSLIPAFVLLSNGQLPKTFNQQCIGMLRHYYQHLSEFITDNPNVPVIYNDRLRNQLVSTMDQIFDSIEMSCCESFRDSLIAKQKKVAPSKQAEDYDIEEMDLNAKSINKAFKDVWPIHV